MYSNGDHILEDGQFQDHMEHEVPVQIYLERNHRDIGYVERFTPSFIKVNSTYYNRSLYTFVSRPGY
ncbi:hypothetical protein PV433_28245 [Paenibacillus sp. GYB004]|uniref:hypothetical protein n=1 Tax=Paenibacillus sp. GYB004 TaxID=2994393 RepID=UPI002F963637